MGAVYGKIRSHSLLSNGLGPIATGKRRLVQTSLVIANVVYTGTNSLLYEGLVALGIGSMEWLPEKTWEWNCVWLSDRRPGIF